MPRGTTSISLASSFLPSILMMLPLCVTREMPAVNAALVSFARSRSLASQGSSTRGSASLVSCFTSAVSFFAMCLDLLEYDVSDIEFVYAIDRQTFVPAQVAGFFYCFTIEQVPCLVFGNPFPKGLFIFDLGDCFSNDSGAAHLALSAVDLSLVEGLDDVLFDTLLFFLQCIHRCLERAALGARLQGRVDAIAYLFREHGGLPCL